MEIGLIPKSNTKIQIFQITTKFFAYFLPPIMLKNSKEKFPTKDPSPGSKHWFQDLVLSTGSKHWFQDLVPRPGSKPMFAYLPTPKILITGSVPDSVRLLLSASLLMKSVLSRCDLCAIRH